MQLTLSQARVLVRTLEDDPNGYLYVKVTQNQDLTINVTLDGKTVKYDASGNDVQAEVDSFTGLPVPLLSDNELYAAWRGDRITDKAYRAELSRRN